MQEAQMPAEGNSARRLEQVTFVLDEEVTQLLGPGAAEALKGQALQVGKGTGVGTVEDVQCRPDGTWLVRISLPASPSA